MQKTLLLIVNPRAGKTQSFAPLFHAVSILSGGGYLLSVRTTSQPGEAAALAEKEGAHFDVVVCCGGDGTLNETISGLMRLENKPLLGYLPRGSTNDFAASLHISSHPTQAAAAILREKSQALDIGQWNERYFAYVASFGAFTKSSYSASQNAKNALGHFAYILEGMKDLNTLRPYRVRISADGEVFDGSFLFGAVCNSTSIGGLMKLDAEHVVLDDGKFELFLVPNPKNATELQNMLMALLSQKYEQGGLIFRHVSHIEVRTEEPLPWSLDGEYAQSAPFVEIKNHQRALTLLL